MGLLQVYLAYTKVNFAEWLMQDITVLKTFLSPDQQHQSTEGTVTQQDIIVINGLLLNIICGQLQP